MNDLLKNFLLVGAGGMAGSMLRYALYLLIRNHPFPMATFTVNVVGSLIIGLLIGVSSKSPGFQSLHLLLATGLCGGFTTFSAFSADNLQLLNEGRVGLMLLYAASSVLFALIATFIGYKISMAV